ncbi:thiopeptide-type bacteriocin biosynthesis protein [Streptomyces sp. PT12]|uniref:thiopeptide-type bacteriocin biosynthesis protein n=1 Tax=Streptomyces sp. PT12 TaxID=1510197 RepID=UPI000DE3BF42|nr:thiopeptide-type bacteriocin biosynthesis protein [Streptomyces sp. PT12]RBM04528.1 methyltransferase [Streptomyces sp. PT12]
MGTPWRQLNVAFPHWATSEHTALTHLAPCMAAAEAEGLIAAWFFIRKAPCWRIRCQPADDPTTTEKHLLREIGRLKQQGLINALTPVIYEPEVHAFGGPQAMAAAHRLFHLDSHHLLDHLTHNPGDGHRRELSILLNTAMLRAAGLDWYEQGDVWARVADHRDSPEPPPADRLSNLQAALRRIMSADITSLTRESATLTVAATWPHAFTTAGRELADLATTGQLHRGLRAVLAHHIIFAWNRLGLPHTAQAILATTAKAVIFGPPDPASPHKPREGQTWPPTAR